MAVLQNCVLTYFGIPGRGEATRLALTIGKIPFTDHRLPFSEWKSVKPTTPWGSLPLLQLSDGTVIAQQRAILRIVGKETNLYPSDNIVAAAQIDSFLDAVEDITAKTNAAGQGLEAAEKLAARQAACQAGGTTHAILQSINAFIDTHGSHGHAVGSSLTIADLFLYATSSSLVSGLFDGVPQTVLQSFPKIMAVRQTVRSHPSVVQYYDGLDASIVMPPSFGPIE